jgi:hypothetical protein
LEEAKRELKQMQDQVDEIRAEYRNIEIKEKERMDQVYKGGLQDDRYLTTQADH